MIRTTVFTFCVVALFSVITEMKSHGVEREGEFHHFMSNYGECECGISPVPTGSKFINGYEAPPNKYPWMVALFADGVPVCGGTLITPNFVLTAADCFDGRAMVRQYTIGLTQYSSKWMEFQEHIPMKELIIHPSFHNRLWENDIALLQLVRPIKCSEFRRPICLADNQVPDLKPGSSVIMTGLGRTGPTRLIWTPQNSSLLREGRVIVQMPKNVRFEFPTQNHTITIGPFDKYKPRSGEPLMDVVNGRYYSYGVVSRHKNGGRDKAEPHFYSNVKLYLNWIHQTIRERLLKSRY